MQQVVSEEEEKFEQCWISVAVAANASGLNLDKRLENWLATEKA